VVGANDKTTPPACRKNGIAEQTYNRLRNEYGGEQVDQPRRLKELGQKNARLKRMAADLSLDKLVLKDIASGNFYGGSPIRVKSQGGVQCGVFLSKTPIKGCGSALYQLENRYKPGSSALRDEPCL
jgi:putative transposase